MKTPTLNKRMVQLATRPMNSAFPNRPDRWPVLRHLALAATLALGNNLAWADAMGFPGVCFAPTPPPVAEAAQPRAPYDDFTVFYMDAEHAQAEMEALQLQERMLASSPDLNEVMEPTAAGPVAEPPLEPCQGF